MIIQGPDIDQLQLYALDLLERSATSTA